MSDFERLLHAITAHDCYVHVERAGRFDPFDREGDPNAVVAVVRTSRRGAAYPATVEGLTQALADLATPGFFAGTADAVEERG
jgi:hypothetical protein